MEKKTETALKKEKIYSFSNYLSLLSRIYLKEIQKQSSSKPTGVVHRKAVSRETAFTVNRVRGKVKEFPVHNGRPRFENSRIETPESRQRLSSDLISLYWEISFLNSRKSILDEVFQKARTMKKLKLALDAVEEICISRTETDRYARYNETLSLYKEKKKQIAAVLLKDRTISEFEIDYILFDRISDQHRFEDSAWNDFRERYFSQEGDYCRESAESFHRKIMELRKSEEILQKEIRKNADLLKREEIKLKGGKGSLIVFLLREDLYYESKLSLLEMQMQKARYVSEIFPLSEVPIRKNSEERK